MLKLDLDGDDDGDDNSDVYGDDLDEVAAAIVKQGSRASSGWLAANLTDEYPLTPEVEKKSSRLTVDQIKGQRTTYVEARSSLLYMAAIMTCSICAVTFVYMLIFPSQAAIEYRALTGIILIIGCLSLDDSLLRAVLHARASGIDLLLVVLVGSSVGAGLWTIHTFRDFFPAHTHQVLLVASVFFFFFGVYGVYMFTVLARYLYPDVGDDLESVRAGSDALIEDVCRYMRRCLFSYTEDESGAVVCSYKSFGMSPEVISVLSMSIPCILAPLLLPGDLQLESYIAALVIYFVCAFIQLRPGTSPEMHIGMVMTAPLYLLPFMQVAVSSLSIGEHSSLRPVLDTDAPVSLQLLVLAAAYCLILSSAIFACVSPFIRAALYMFQSGVLQNGRIKQGENDDSADDTRAYIGDVVSSEKERKEALASSRMIIRIAGLVSIAFSFTLALGEVIMMARSVNDYPPIYSLVTSVVVSFGFISMLRALARKSDTDRGIQRRIIWIALVKLVLVSLLWLNHIIRGGVYGGVFRSTTRVGSLPSSELEAVCRCSHYVCCVCISRPATI